MKKPALILRRRIWHTLSCVLMACVCVAAVLFMDAAEEKHGLRRDFSFNAISSHSETTQKVLSSLKTPVHVYALFSDGSEDLQLMELLNRYQAASKYFTWSQENLVRNPLLAQLISGEMTEAGVASDCLVVRCEKTGRMRVLSGSDYIQYSYNTQTGVYDVAGWTYEKSISEALMYVTSEELPVLQILTGHDELDEEEAAAMENKLQSANYQLVRLDLRLGDIPDPTSPLLILSPRMDLTERELDTLYQFAQLGGSFFITVDFDDPDELPNFFSLYREYGFKPLPGILVADENDPKSYFYDNSQLLPQMLPSDVTNVLYANDYTHIIMIGARALEMPQETDDPSLLMSVCLQSGDTAYIRDFDETMTNEQISAVRQEGDLTGTFALALCADRAFSDGMRSRAFIIGSSAIFTDSTGYMYNNTYAGELLLHAVQYLGGEEPIDLDIVAREAVRPQLDFAEPTVPALLLTLPPLMVLVIALAVLRPRKHL